MAVALGSNARMRTPAAKAALAVTNHDAMPCRHTHQPRFGGTSLIKTSPWSLSHSLFHESDSLRYLVGLPP